MTPRSPGIEYLGDTALLLRWEARIDDAINAQVHAVAAQIDAHRPAWLLDLVPAYASLALFLDPEAFGPDDAPLQIARDWLLQHALCPQTANSRANPHLIDVPVRYGGEDGPDLAQVAAITGLDAEEVIARHCGGDYRVAMLGFAPGFPYLLGLDPRLNVARLAQPRLRVAAGSVAIGGAQTGIYPRASPGGWRVIGRTDLALFDPERAMPSLLRPGDRVRFVRVAARPA